jgi:high-affinity Fe2+/Pb2+ permease
MVFSLLWWSTTFVVIFIIRPANRTGNLSIVLPKIRRVIIIASTISITSGLILYGMLFNFNIQNFINTTDSFLILISGLLSLIVYYHVLLGTHRSLLNSKSNMLGGIVSTKIIPYLMFGLLSTTMVSMIIASSMVFS